MAGLPLAELPLVTPGEGAAASCGVAPDSDVDAADWEEDKDAASQGLPSYLGSQASGMPGDLSDGDEVQDIFEKPEWDDDTKCTEGEWKHQTRGGGAVDAGGQAGTYGVYQGNWGNVWHEKPLQQHMLQDIMSSPAQIIVLQETGVTMLKELEGMPDGDALRAIRDGGGGNEGAQGQRQPGCRFIGIRGPECWPFGSTMIAGRRSLVTGIRLLLFHRSFDGTYKKNKAWKTCENQERSDPGNGCLFKNEVFQNPRWRG